MSNQITLEKIYPQPIEKVWAALTDQQAMANWLMENDFVPQVGHKFRFHTKPQPLFGFDGVVYCEVLELDAPNLLVYSWQGSGMPQPTIVTWKLSQFENGTKLRLEHNGFSGVNGFIVQRILGAGWKKILQKRIPAWIENQTSASFQ